jgi:hypothetical protein
VSQRLLDEAQVHTSCEPLGSPGVATRVNRRALGEATGLERGTEGIWHTRAWHGLGCGGHAGACPAGSWEDPDRVAMGDPLGA